MQRLKISREGIILIKSFEGFRPRAVPRETGGWTIGYGHTLSAREGATVSEADAELLLQYDLIPVAQAVNGGVAEGVGDPINQHQFDALASFAFSVGIDAFQTSNVLARLKSGSPNEAADAIIEWPETITPATSVRRRAAERALFVADPASPVALSDLLAAPLPPPSAILSAAPSFAVDALLAKPVPGPQSSDPTAWADARQAAVASLLGEAAESSILPDAPVSTGALQTDMAETHSPETDSPETEGPIAAMGAPDPASAAPFSPVESSETPEPGLAPIVTGPLGDAASVTDVVIADMLPRSFSATLPRQRYMPFSNPMIGPLPGTTMPQAMAQPEPVQPSAGIVAALDAPLAKGFPDEPSTPVEPATIVPLWPTPMQATAPVEAEPLVLTPASENDAPIPTRLVWPQDDHAVTDTTAAALFEDEGDLNLTGAPLIQHEESQDAAPQRVAWGEMGAFLLMGGFGLVSFGMSMAAFRRTSQQASGSDELTVIAIVLAVFGAACVGVSAYNLYRRWGREDVA